MKVVVSYACDLGDIPENVAELLMNLKKQFDDSELLLENAEIASRDVKVTEAMKNIDDLRQLLAKIDNRLMDYSSILAGYAKTDADIKMGIDPSKVETEDEPEKAND